jgi:ATPase complex subunit ATP10
MNVSRGPIRRAYRSIGLDAQACLRCQWRSFYFSHRRLAEPAKKAPIAEKALPIVQPPPENPLADAPKAYGKSVDQFEPKPLNRPIGLQRPPRAGENSGLDSRSWKQKRDDFVDYDKHLERRKQLYADYTPIETLC